MPYKLYIFGVFTMSFCTGYQDQGTVLQRFTSLTVYRICILFLPPSLVFSLCCCHTQSCLLKNQQSVIFTFVTQTSNTFHTEPSVLESSLIWRHFHLHFTPNQTAYVVSEVTLPVLKTLNSCKYFLSLQWLLGMNIKICALISPDRNHGYGGNVDRDHIPSWESTLITKLSKK